MEQKEQVSNLAQIAQNPLLCEPKAEPSCGGDCGMNYCDEYGCIDAKQSVAELREPPQDGA